MDQYQQENLLIIAPELPRYDWNSGDLRLFSILKILVKNYRIYYMPYGLLPGAQKYISELEVIGVNVLPPDTLMPGLFKQKQFKAAILEFYYMAEYFLPRIKLLQPGCRVIVDTVDVHFLRVMMMRRVTGNLAALGNDAENKKRELSVYSQADVVVTVTEDDGRALTDECPTINLQVIPNIHEIVPPIAPAKGAGLIFVGGFYHPPNIDAVLYFCREVLPLVRKRVPDVRVTIVGSNPPPEVLALRDKDVDVTGFVPSTTPYLHASRVSIAPLRFGAGMKGKIGEAMAHGVPVVTTSVGAQGMGLQHGVNVMIADEPESFATAVEKLLSDTGLSGRIKKNAMEHLSRNYSPVQVAHQMNSILEKLDATPARTMSMCAKARFLGRWGLEKFLGFAAVRQRIAVLAQPLEYLRKG
jgi:O-antigen biosynthesis protein